MADIPFDALQSGGGDGVSLNGAQAFTNFNVGSTAVLGNVTTSTIDISSALTTVFSISGKYAMSYLALNAINTTSGSLRIQLLVDGVVVADNTAASSTVGSVTVLNAPYSAIRCNTSIELKATKPLSTAVTANYVALAVL